MWFLEFKSSYLKLELYNLCEKYRTSKYFIIIESQPLTTQYRGFFFIKDSNFGHHKRNNSFNLNCGLKTAACRGAERRKQINI